MLATEAETAILKRVLRPDIGDVSPDAAKALLRLTFAESDHARMTELSEKAQAGTLSAPEQDELDGYINVSHLIAFIQSKARLSLRNARPAPSAA
jgi:hypothetical protein